MSKDDTAAHSEAGNGTALEEKSRSQKKRESTALQKAGEALAALSPAQWKALRLPANLTEALAAWQGMNSHEAKRRQMQYIGRLMREADDHARILADVEALRRGHYQDAKRFTALEDLRARLVSPNETERHAACEEALSALPALSRSKLVHLVEAARVEREKKRPPRHFRELFRYLRDAEAAGEEE